MSEKLKIGLFVDNNRIQTWLFEMLIILQKSSTNQIVLLVELRNSKKMNPFRHFYEKRNHLVYEVYKKLDRKKYKNENDASDLKKLDSLICTDSFVVDSAFDEDLIKKIEEYKIDIIINLSKIDFTGNLFSSVKFGVWSYYFGDNSSPPGFWEVMNRIGEMEVGLKMSNSKGEWILYKSYSISDNLSVYRGLNAVKWKMQFFIPRKIEEIYNIGEDNFIKELRQIDESDKGNKIPTNLKMLSKWVQFQFKRGKLSYEGIFKFHQWILLYKIDNSINRTPSFSEFKKILPPKDRFWADPHVIFRNGIYYIFIEELIYSENKGFISVIEMDESGNCKDPVKILEEPYHLSYPFVFEDSGETYMIPESKGNDNIQLYKCHNFPYQWELEKVLMDDVKAVDTTIKLYKGKYWMFTNIVKKQGADIDDELYLFYSDQLVTDQWTSHPKNPVISDVRKARSAGKLFIKDNKLFRPSQNCSKIYGYGIQINEILELSLEYYKEEIVDSILPNWEPNLIGTHSFCECNTLTVIDANLNRKK